MIRRITKDDTDASVALADASGLFGPDELEQVREMLAAFVNGNTDSGEFWITDDAGNDGLVGLAYCAPERMTQGTWNVLLLLVRPDRQGQGRGAALMRFIEQTLAARGERLLLVETIASMERTRAFYRKCGYEEEARIRDYYEAGADKIIYRKSLVEPAQ